VRGLVEVVEMSLWALGNSITAEDPNKLLSKEYWSLFVSLG
jgi:hypothetical protein